MRLALLILNALGENEIGMDLPKYASLASAAVILLYRT